MDKMIQNRGFPCLHSFIALQDLFQTMGSESPENDPKKNEAGAHADGGNAIQNPGR